MHYQQSPTQPLISRYVCTFDVSCSYDVPLQNLKQHDYQFDYAWWITAFTLFHVMKLAYALPNTVLPRFTFRDCCVIEGGSGHAIHILWSPKWLLGLGHCLIDGCFRLKRWCRLKPELSGFSQSYQASARVIRLQPELYSVLLLLTMRQNRNG